MEQNEWHKLNIYKWMNNNSNSNNKCGRKFEIAFESIVCKCAYARAVVVSFSIEVECINIYIA